MRELLKLKAISDPGTISGVAIKKGRIGVVYSDNAINIFWDDMPVTKYPGLNFGVNTLGLWTDSTRASWRITERGADHLAAELAFTSLPLKQFVRIRIEDANTISWQIEMEPEEEIYVNEFRIASVVDDRYKAWISDYRYAYFPRPDGRWRDLYQNDSMASIVGATFPAGEARLPSIMLETQARKFLPLIQNPPSDVPGKFIGFREIFRDRGPMFCSAGRKPFFSGKITVSGDSSLLDNRTELLRQSHIRKARRLINRTDKRLKPLMVNLPWMRGDGSQGVRAGSRWPHIKDVSEGNYLPFPFFLCYAVSLLNKNGFETDMIDAIAEGMTEEKFMKLLSEKDPDILVAETSVPSFYYDMRLLRKISSLGISIVLCGPHSETYKEEFLDRYDFIDFVLFGEYELTLLELMKALQEGRKDLSCLDGLIWKDNNGGVIKNHPRPPFDINMLPWPHREGLPMEKYWDLPGDIPHPSAQMLASRGCPFGCTFCLWPQVLFGGRNYRARDVDDVVDEMEYLIKEKKFRSIYFDDDTFNIGKERIMRLCGRIIEKGLNKTPWAIMAKADLMDEELLRSMKEAGLFAVKYGVENVSQALIDSCNKNLNVDNTEKIIKLTKDLGIKTHLTFTFGLPGETKETINKTIDYALKLDPESIQFSVTTPFPGTELFRDLDRQNRILTKDWSLYDGHSSCVFRPEVLSPETLVWAKEYAYRKWAEHKRRQRGLRGDIERFIAYLKASGIKGAARKTASYLNYIFFHKDKFIGKT